MKWAQMTQQNVLTHTYTHTCWCDVTPTELCICTPPTACRHRTLVNIVYVSLCNLQATLSPFFSDTHTQTHPTLMQSIWLMALKTITSAMSGMYGLTWARACVRMSLCVSVFDVSRVDSHSLTPRQLESYHPPLDELISTHTHAKIISSLHYCWIMLFSAAATGFMGWKELRNLKYI